MSKPSDLFPAAYFVAYPSACSAGSKTKVGESNYDHKKVAHDLSIVERLGGIRH
ncbi:hypothetical protein [Alloprevotella tannerae]|uniref:hypothetical protein n=1 Tax=Alloprevotella tannerae TaxID=76122 RepID=UPI0028D19E0F|nr:hypothetical protein [Alloprevotella tannerae]